LPLGIDLSSCRRRAVGGGPRIEGGAVDEQVAQRRVVFGRPPAGSTGAEEDGEIHVIGLHQRNRLSNRAVGRRLVCRPSLARSKAFIFAANAGW
jgi:hypothetical protein